MFVLLPGGSFRMGSDPAEDPLARGEAPVREVSLEPFFLSKYELTPAPWLRARTSAIIGKPVFTVSTPAILGSRETGRSPPTASGGFSAPT